MTRTRALVLVAALILGALALTPDAADAAARPKIKVLFEVGGGYHDFINLPPILKGILERTGDFEVTVSDDRARLAHPAIDAFDVVLFFTQGGSLTPGQEKGLTEFVRQGKGYAGIHCASDSFKDSDAYWQLAGGRFTNHRYGTFAVKIEDPTHPITCWLGDFEITDEDYDHAFHPKAAIHVLARRAKDNQPAAWVQQYGKGRVFFTGLGHGDLAWKNPAFQELVVRGLYWAAGRGPKSPVR